jgi:hypothetical protein
MMTFFQPLRSDEIEDLIHADPFAADKFLGVYSSEKTPFIKRFPCGFIWNTDDSKHRGEHWVSVFFDSAGHGCYFDPLGLPPLWDKWEDYLRDMSNDGCWYYTTKTVQYPLSSTCGYHSIFYVLCRCRGLTSHEVMNMYSSNLLENDDFVVHSIHKLMTSVE